MLCFYHEFSFCKNDSRLAKVTRVKPRTRGYIFSPNLHHIGIVNSISGENCLSLTWATSPNFFSHKMTAGIYESGKSKKEVYFAYNLYTLDSGPGAFMQILD